MFQSYTKSVLQSQDTELMLHNQGPKVSVIMPGHKSQCYTVSDTKSMLQNQYTTSMVKSQDTKEVLQSKDTKVVLQGQDTKTKLQSQDTKSKSQGHSQCYITNDTKSKSQGHKLNVT